MRTPGRTDSRAVASSSCVQMICQFRLTASRAWSVRTRHSHEPAEKSSHEWIPAAPATNQVLKVPEVHLGAEVAQDLKVGPLGPAVRDPIASGRKDWAQEERRVLPRRKVGEDELASCQDRQDLQHGGAPAEETMMEAADPEASSETSKIT